MLHTYLKLHEAKQNDAGERLIGSGLVSAPFVGSLQETHRTKVFVVGAGAGAGERVTSLHVSAV